MTIVGCETLEAVDMVHITVLVDNLVDRLLTSSARVSRFSTGKIDESLLAEHGLS
jgi:hypothetical protein